ncbi:unnamed protein product [Adineta steineri]|uniref:T4 RNA ligase 1 C-terminal domain-containing protein n=2 Tax=Adineta steineri TaxID=433720 RepID=A0A818XSE6_9BILA|nr:unnamed protein product [Adineta steineri]
MDTLMPELYENLVSLCSKDIGFCFKDIEYDSLKYRIFNYNLCSYDQFSNNPSALNCRGTMFDITNLEDIQLVCLPPEKFFNYEEGNGANIHRLGTFGVQMEKLDGSLISTYLHKQQMKLKSKASLTSSQAIEATQLLTGNYFDEIEKIVRDNKTVNFEYTSPSNQVVLYYDQSQLRIISIRCHLTGKTLFGNKLIEYLKENNFTTSILNVVSFKNIVNDITHDKLLNDIRSEIEGEGYVIEIINSNQISYLVKIKNTKYLLLHHTKFNCTSNKYLFECVINEQTDDLRSLFVNQDGYLQRIKDMEKKVQPIYNKIIQTVESFYEENKNLSRKDYAIKATNSNDMKIYMSLLMNLYGGKENDYKKFSINQMKTIFEISDDKNTNTEQD